MSRTVANVCFAVYIVLALLLFKALLFVPNFIRLRKYLKTEIARTSDRQERKYWKRELRKLRCCFIPFITVNNVDSVFRFFGWRNKK